jgi:hypothetical protein
MTRKITPSFVLELPVRTPAADERALAIGLDASRAIDNAWRGEAFRLDLMRQSKAWQAAGSGITRFRTGGICVPPSSRASFTGTVRTRARLVRLGQMRRGFRERRHQADFDRQAIGALPCRTSRSASERVAREILVRSATSCKGRHSSGDPRWPMTGNPLSSAASFISGSRALFEGT